ncbi:EGF-like domain protein [Trichuris suis]|nr:EGF-like domain protein [Trichuris suis]
MPISVLVNELQVDNGDCTNGLIEVYEGFFPAKQALISKFCNLTSMPALIGTNTSNEILLVARIYKWTSATTVKGKVLRDFSCNSALCKNAACVQESNTIKCDCTGGYGGPTCQEPLCGQIILHKEQGTVQSYLPSMNDPFSYCFYAIISQQQSIIFIYLFTYIPDKAPANAILAFDGPDETYDNVDLSRQESTFLSKGNAFSILLTLANEDESEYDPPSFEVMYTEVSKAKSIFVNFLYFNVGSCNHSSVSIHYNGNWTRLCGDKTGWSKKFNTNILRIRLEFTKYVDEYQGFTANYTTSETQKEKEGDRLFYGHKERILT